MERRGWRSIEDNLCHVPLDRNSWNIRQRQTPGSEACAKTSLRRGAANKSIPPLRPESYPPGGLAYGHIPSMTKSEEFFPWCSPSRSRNQHVYQLIPARNLEAPISNCSPSPWSTTAASPEASVVRR